jgi:hypothetical protein
MPCCQQAVLVHKRSKQDSREQLARPPKCVRFVLACLIREKVLSEFPFLGWSLMEFGKERRIINLWTVTKRTRHNVSQSCVEGKYRGERLP